MNDYQRLSVSTIDGVWTVSNAQGKVWQIAGRRWYGLSFCRSGKLIYLHQGREYVSARGTAIFLPKGATYQLHCPEAGEFPLINFQIEGNCLPDEFLCVPAPEDFYWENDYAAMERLYLSPTPGQYPLKALMYRILDQLTREAEKNALPAVLYAGLSYLETHLDDPALNNDRIAAHAGISEVYLRRLFARHFDLSPRQYLLKKRLEKACILLHNPEFSIGEVAERCGFSSIYHFSRAFSAAQGCPPSKYRALHQAQLY